MQDPIGQLVGEAPPGSVDEWEARAQLDIGLLIARYLADRPAPGRSRHADLYRQWSDSLQAAGRSRLMDVGARRFQAV